MARQLEHHHVATRQFQHGLLLGLHDPSSRRRDQGESICQVIDSPTNKLKQANPTKEIDERSRAQSSHPLPDYNFKSYLSYALYPPLYLAGPIITYNSFLSQLASPPTISRAQIIAYTGRFVTCLLTMELVLHSMYVVAIKDSSREGAWMGSTPFELSMIGFWNLIVVWLKVGHH
jgi:D-alanyl-lipoteichoic acid acyltransferase DltB (MBOAT superfamily)